ncbi:hypothetical protein JQC92_13345 [Shewanella sp. 202IG2-18]|uniref:hypothetical protein n=1 Tax=Parashewanella hymeniacidonis TaxID=2807618 RepID=UPI001960C7F6|nr:hypothetical protein [Parashewanella hymeniacidonis]MBM7073001.1 hypothetical protein [Parashewanella hymeniacidonis]
MNIKSAEINTSNCLKYRYKLNSILQLNSGEFSFSFMDDKRHKQFQIHSKDIKFRQDILYQCDPAEVFNLGYLCALPASEAKT